jgi:hypothetical protein
MIEIAQVGVFTKTTYNVKAVINELIYKRLLGEISVSHQVFRYYLPFFLASNYGTGVIVK